MTQTVTNELILELLKKIQADVAHIRDDHAHQLRLLREQMHGIAGDIHNLQGEFIRIDNRLDRIERRLDLADAE